MARPAIEIQKKLKKEGFDPGKLDGKFGNKTEAAFLAFLRSKGLPEDLEFGEASEAALFGQAMVRKRAPSDRLRRKEMDIDEGALRKEIKARKQRPTVASLAKKFGVDDEVMRHKLHVSGIGDDMVEF